MHASEFASCFVGARIGYNVSQEIHSVGTLVNGQHYDAPGFGIVYYNLTRHDVYVVYGDGRRLRVRPAPRGLIGDTIMNKAFVNKYDGQFVIVKTPNLYYSIDKTKLEIETIGGKKVNLHQAELDVIKKRTDENGDYLSVIKSVGEKQLSENYTGIPIPDLFITIGFDKADYIVQNKIAAIFPNKGGGSPTAGIRMHAVVSASYLNKIYIVSGLAIYEIEPKLDDNASNRIYFYRTGITGEERLVSEVHIDELFKADVEGFKAFRTSKEAEEYTESLKSMEKNFSKVKEQAKQLEEEVEKLKIEKEQAKAEAKAEKAKNANSKWSKLASIVTATCTVIAAIVGLAIKFL